MDIHLECEVCFEDYDSSDRKPMILDCGHTLCLECLKLIHRTSRECPMDRKNISKEIQEISPNYILMQLLQASASKPPKSPRNLSENTHNRGARKESRRSGRGRGARGHHSIPRDMNPDPRPLANNPPEASNQEEVKIPIESKKKFNFKKRNVVFKNLPKQYDENKLLNLCYQFGGVESHHFGKNRDRPGDRHGIAYVMFRNEVDAMNAVFSLNGIEFEGNKITVEMWRDFDKKEKVINKVKHIVRAAQQDQSMNPQTEQSSDSNLDGSSSRGDRQVSIVRAHHSRGTNSLRRQTQHKRGSIRQAVNNRPEYEELKDFGEKPIQYGPQLQHTEVKFEERPSPPAQQLQRVNPPHNRILQAPIVPQSHHVPPFQPSTIYASPQPAQIHIVPQSGQVPHLKPSTIHSSSQPAQIPPQRQVLSSQPAQIPPQIPVIATQPPQVATQRPVISSQPPQIPTQIPVIYSQPPQQMASQFPQHQPQNPHQSHQYPPQIPINCYQPPQYPSQNPDIVYQLAQILPQRSNIIPQPQQTPILNNPYVGSSNPPAPNSKPQVPQARNSPIAPTSVQPLDTILQSLRLNHPDSRPQHQQDLPIRSQYESNPSIPPVPVYTQNNGTNLPSYSRPTTSEKPQSSIYPYQLANMSSPAQKEYTGGGSISRPAVISNPYEVRDNVIPNPYEPRHDGSSHSRANPYDMFNPNSYVRNPYEEPSTSNREYKYNNPYLNKK